MGCCEVVYVGGGGGGGVVGGVGGVEDDRVGVAAAGWGRSGGELEAAEEGEGGGEVGLEEGEEGGWGEGLVGCYCYGHCEGGGGDAGSCKGSGDS